MTWDPPFGVLNKIRKDQIYTVDTWFYKRRSLINNNLTQRWSMNHTFLHELTYIFLKLSFLFLTKTFGLTCAFTKDTKKKCKVQRKSTGVQFYVDVHSIFKEDC